MKKAGIIACLFFELLIFTWTRVDAQAATFIQGNSRDPFSTPEIAAPAPKEIGGTASIPDRAAVKSNPFASARTSMSADAGPDQNLCNVNTVTLAAATPPIGSGTWSLLSGPNVPTITDPTNPASGVTGMIAGVYTFRWTVDTGSGFETDDVQITIYALPTTSNAGPDQNLCNVTSVSLAGNTPVNGTGTWTRISGPNVPTITTPGASNTTVTGMIAGVYIFRWTISSGVCAPSSDDVQITIYSLPTTADAGADQNLCNVTFALITGNLPATGTGAWSLVSGPNTPTITSPAGPTTTVLGMIPGVYDFRWTISNGTCAVSADDVQITISALPSTANAGPDQGLCNVTSATLAGNSPASGAGNWSFISGPNSPSITLPSNPSSTVTGMVTGVYVFRWTTSNGSCASSTDDVQITIFPPPSASNAGPDQELCNAGSATMAGNTPGTGTGAWSMISGPNTPTITAPSNPSTSITGLTAGIYVFRWTISNGTCATSTDDVQITIDPLPAAANAGPDQALCNAATTTLAGNTPATGTGTWTLVSGPNVPVITVPGNPSSTVTGLIPGVYVFRWTVSSGVCVPTSDDVQITVYALPTSANAGPDQLLCNVTNTTFAGNVPVTGTGNWTLITGPNTPTITSPGSPNSTVIGMVTGVYIFRWSITNGPCVTSADDIQITIYAPPSPANAGPDQNLCNVTTTSLSGNSPATGSGTWILVSGPNTPVITTPSSPTSAVTGMIAGVYDFQWSVSNGTCAPATDDVQITIYALPTTADAGPDQSLCNAASATLAGNIPATGNGTWTLISGPNSPVITSPSSPNTTITGMIAGVYVFRWSIVNGNCAASTDDVQITDNSLPSVSNAGPDQNLCNAATTTLSANTPVVGSGSWSLVSGPNVPSITTSSNPGSTVTGMIPGVYVFRWTITNGPCAVTTDDIQITNYDLPSVPDAGMDQALCNAVSATLAATAPASGSGNWIFISGPNAPVITSPSNPLSTVTGMIPGTYIFRWTVTNGVCASVYDDVQLINYALPTLPNAGTDQSLCNVSSTSMAGNTPVTGTGNWSLVSGPNTPAITTPSSPVTSITGMMTGIYVFRWTISNGSCPGSGDDVQVTVYDLPTPSDAGPDQDLCNVTGTTLAGNTPVAGTGTWTLVSGPNVPVITTPTSPASTVTGMITGLYIFRWTIVNGVCAPSTDDVQVTIFANPTSSNAGVDQNLCNVTSTMLSANTPLIGTGSWSTISGPNVPVMSDSLNPATTVAGLSFGTYDFRWTISNGTCVVSSTDVLVTVFNQPTAADAGPDQDLCSVSTTVMEANVPGAGIGTWIQISGPNTAGIVDIHDPSTTMNGLIPGLYVFGWNITNGVCIGQTDTMWISIAGIPTTADAGPDQNLCAADSAVLAAATPTTGTGTWSAFSGPGPVTFSDSSDAGATVHGLVTGTYIFKWTVTNGSCPASSDTVSINVFNIPTPANAGFDRTMCNSDSVVLAANSPVSSTGNWIFLNGPYVPAIADPSDPATSVTGLVPGVYSFSWTVTNGVCPATTDTVMVVNDNLPSLSNAGSDQNLCQATASVLAANSPGYGTGMWSFVSGPSAPIISIPGNPASTVNGLITGTYTFMWNITSGSCPVSSDSVQVVISDLPTPAIAGPDQHLCSSATFALNGNTPATGTGSWSLISGPNSPLITSPGNPTTSVTGVTGGSYTFRWTIVNGSCATSSDDVQIDNIGVPTVVDAGPDQVLCNSTSTLVSGNSPALGSGTWSQFSGPNSAVIVSPGNPSTTINGLVAGTYLFGWSIDNGVCTPVADTVQILVNDLPAVADAGIDQHLCSPVVINLAGNIPVTGAGSWSFVSGPNIPVITDTNNAVTTVTGFVPGIYSFEWSVMNGSCPVSRDTLMVTVDNLPSVVNAGPDQSFCNTGSAVITGNNPLIGYGTWTFISGPTVPVIAVPTDSTTNVSGLAPGNYRFVWTITNGSCTPISDTVQITNYDLPSIANAGPDQDLCLSASTTLAAVPVTTGTGSWSFISGPGLPMFSNASSETTSVSGLVPGTYLFSWTVANGACLTSADTVMITVNTLPAAASAGPDQVLCNATSAVMAGNVPSGGTGNWALISGPNVPAIVAPGSPSTAINNLVPGTYVFRWTLSNGSCGSTTSMMQLVNDDLPTPSIAGPNQQLCNNTFTVATTTLAGNNPTIGLGTWSQVSGPVGSFIFSPNSPSTTVTGLVSGTYVFRWTIANGSCAASFSDMQIDVYTVPAYSDAGPDQHLCTATSVTLAGDTTPDGIGTWTLISGPNNPVIVSPNSPATSVTGLTFGTYEFGWTFNNIICSTPTDTVRISIDDLPTVAAAGTDQVLCHDSVTTLSANVPSSGTGNWSMVSGPAPPVFTDPRNPNTSVSNLVPGVYIFRWTISTIACDSTVDDMQVTINDLVRPVFTGADQVTCGDTTALISGSVPNAGMGTWTFINGPVTPVIICPNCPTTLISGLTTVGSYDLLWTVTNGMCGSASDSIRVTVQPGVTAALAGTDQSLCSQDSTGLLGNVPANGTGLWSITGGPGFPVIDYPDSAITSVTDLEPGIYTFRWTITNGMCKSFDEMQVTMNINPVVRVSEHQLISCHGQPVTMVASGADTYAWTPGARLSDSTIFNPVATPPHNATYVVTGTDTNGCSATDSVSILVCDTLMIPDGFSPDGDGVNDFYVIDGIEAYVGNTLHVYNRWGNLVYEAVNYKNDWGGIPNVKGISIDTGMLPPGNYYYVLELGAGENPRTGFLVIKY